ncbi:MAG: signal peptidase I [Planctomycetota bacterium]|nr:signal peptidase I [Planctomycetota bacterium]
MDERPVGAEDGRLSAEQSGGAQVPATQAGTQGPAAQEGGQAESDEDDEQSALKEWVELLVRAGFWALLIYLFIFQVSIVDGDSMSPTFHHEDKLVIDKVTYRFSPVQRLDVIVFEAVDADKIPRRPRDYIKRVVGLPGETVSIHDGAVWVNGAKLEDAFSPTYSNSFMDGRQRQTFVVPERYYFVLGDNRRASKDSRVEGRQSLGFVAAGQIKGLVRLRFWPWRNWTWFRRGQ